MYKSYSQSYQDIFALVTCKNKTYIEIGGNRPKKWNNTFLLEQHGFKGFSIERNLKWQNLWTEARRNNPIYWDDALTFDYFKTLQDNGLSKNVGYLSCDIEPAKNTFDALKKVIQDGVEFECITFEDDRYNESESYNTYATDFLKDYGYKVAVKDVYTLDNKQLFETWFVKNDYDIKETSFEQWLSVYGK